MIDGLKVRLHETKNNNKNCRTDFLIEGGWKIDTTVHSVMDCDVQPSLSNVSHKQPMPVYDRALLYRKYHIETIGNNLAMTTALWQSEREKIHESWSAGTPISTESEYVCELKLFMSHSRWHAVNVEKMKARSRWRDRGIAAESVRVWEIERASAKKDTPPNKWIVRKFIACYITTNTAYNREHNTA